MLSELQSKLFKSDYNLPVATTLFNIAMRWSEIGNISKALELMQKVDGIKFIIFYFELNKSVFRN